MFHKGLAKSGQISKDWDLEDGSHPVPLCIDSKNKLLPQPGPSVKETAVCSTAGKTMRFFGSPVVFKQRSSMLLHCILVNEKVVPIPTEPNLELDHDGCSNLNQPRHWR